MRLWIPALIMVGASLWFGWVWGFSEGSRQDKVMAAGGIGLVTTALLFLWLLLLSRLPLLGRLSVVVGAAALGGAAFGLLEVRGVTGDLIPIIGFKYSKRPELAASVPSVSSTEQTAAPTDSSRAADDGTAYPQFLGPDRNGRVDGVRLARDWSARPPRLVWERDVGAGWSGFAVSGRDAITQEQRGEQECVVCYDRATGEPRWIHADDARYDNVVGGVGPRATPTIDGDRVFTLGSTGRLNALDRSNGEIVWSRDILDDNAAPQNEWGMSGSPLVRDDVVVVFAGGGGSVCAYDRVTGEPAWRGGTDRTGYSSPLQIELAGRSQIVALQGNSVAGYDADHGMLLWSTEWSALQPNVAQPLPLSGDRLLVSSGYGVGSALFHITRGPSGSIGVDELWRSRSLKAKFSNFHHRDGFVYGMDDGIMVCIDVLTGERRWKGGRYGHGQMILVDDLLLVTEEYGDVLLVEATPDELREVSRFTAFDEKQWNPPAFAPPHLFVRTASRAACYELPLE